MFSCIFLVYVYARLICSTLSLTSTQHVHYLQIIKDGAEHEDLADLAKLFDLHESPIDATTTE